MLPMLEYLTESVAEEDASFAASSKTWPFFQLGAAEKFV